MSGNAPSPQPSKVFDFFFIRSVPAVIWTMLLLFTGIVGYNGMVKESLPDLEIPEAYILTRWEGASPLMVEKEVTQVIEQRLRGLKGLKKMYSSSKDEMSIITVSFFADAPMLESMQLLQQKVTAAQGYLPKSAERPKVEATSVRDLPIGVISLSGAAPASVLEKQAKVLKRKLERIPGIKRAQVLGDREKAVLVQLLPERLNALGVPATLVRSRIMSHGVDAPWGEFENPDLNFSMKLDGAYRSLESLENIVIARQPDKNGGGVVRLRDVALVKKGRLRERTRASMSWRGDQFVPVIGLNLYKSPGRDTIALIEKTKALIAQATASPLWPAGVECRLSGDEAESILIELERGFNNGWQAMLAVFLVLFFLLTWREALAAALSVPLTLLGAMAVLWAMGYTFNMLVLVGMILALGLLVDDFILIMEGMHEAVFIKGLGYVEAVRRTIQTYAIPSFSGSLTTILVFLPLAFVGGVDGKFIRVIPVAAAVCLVMSYIVSILLGPPLARLFLGAEKQHQPGLVDRISHRVETGLGDWLGRSVVRSRKQALCWVLGAGALFLVSLVFALSLRDTLYPKEDGRGLGITVELAPETTLEQSAAVAEKLGDVLRSKPYFQHITQLVGGKDNYSLSSFHDMIGRNQDSNLIGFSCFLTPGKERDKLAYEYSEPLRAELERVLLGYPGARVFMSPQVGGPSGEDPVQIDITGTDMHRLREIATEVKTLLAQPPGVVDVRDTLGPPRAELRFRPMREALDHYRVSEKDLAGQMIAYTENEKISKFRLPGVEDDLDIRLSAWRLSSQGRVNSPKRWEELALLSIINDEGRPVPLWSLADAELTEAGQVILHKEGRRSVTVRAKLHGAYVSEVLARMRPKMDALQKTWPPEYSYDFAGEEDVNNTYMNMLRVFLLSIVLVYAVLALLFNSLLHPGIILSTVLFSLIGVFTGFFLLGLPFSFSASIGIVALVGIVVNDAIIMVETMNNHRKQGLGLFDAARRGAADRIRPITSTTVTNFAGLTPLALSDPGWAPLCQAIIFGEMTATVGAVILIPALYVLLTSKTQQP